MKNLINPGGPRQHRTRRKVLIEALAAGLVGAGFSAQAQSGDYPAKAVTFIIPYPPGGLGDAACRRLALRLSDIWKVPVPVENKPGAAGLLGAGIVAKAPADGYTLMYTIPETLSITKAARQNPGFDPVGDFQPIPLSVLSSVVLTVPADSPHKTFKDFIDYAKKNPGKLNFGIQGTGSGFHLALEALKAAAAVDIIAVPYKGAAPAMIDLLGGRLDAMMNCAGGSLQEDLPVHQMDLAIWHQTIALNLLHPFLCCRHGIPHMISSGGGSIINISSHLGLMGSEKPAYAAAKGGLVSFTKTVAAQYVEFGIRANAIGRRRSIRRSDA